MHKILHKLYHGFFLLTYMTVFVWAIVIALYMGALVGGIDEGRYAMGVFAFIILSASFLISFWRQKLLPGDTGYSYHLSQFRSGKKYPERHTDTRRHVFCSAVVVIFFLLTWLDAALFHIFPGQGAPWEVSPHGAASFFLTYNIQLMLLVASIILISYVMYFIIKHTWGRYMRLSKSLFSIVLVSNLVIIGGLALFLFAGDPVVAALFDHPPLWLSILIWFFGGSLFAISFWTVFPMGKIWHKIYNVIHR